MEENMKIKVLIFVILFGTVAMTLNGCLSSASEFAGTWRYYYNEAKTEYQDMIFDTNFADKYTKDDVYTEEFVGAADYEGCQRINTETGTFFVQNGEMTFYPALKMNEQIKNCVDTSKNSTGVKDTTPAEYTLPYIKDAQITLRLGEITYDFVE